MAAVGSFNILPADVFELRRRYVIVYTVRLKLKKMLLLLILKIDFTMEQVGSVVWENYSLFPFFTSSLPIPEIYVAYKACLSDTHKEMLTKIGEVFIALRKAITLQIWAGH
jgi:hypothetical protein